MNALEALKRIAAILDAAHIPYMLVGSYASSHYGALRSTKDIDLVIAATPAQLKTLISFLPASEYYRDLQMAMDAYRDKSMFNVLDMVTGFKIDLIFVKQGDFDREAFRRRTSETIGGNPVSVSTPEDIVIAKLDWARQGQSLRQIEDVAGVIKAEWETLDRTYLENWIKKLGLLSQWNDARRQAGIE